MTDEKGILVTIRVVRGHIDELKEARRYLQQGRTKMQPVLEIYSESLRKGEGKVWHIGVLHLRMVAVLQRLWTTIVDITLFDVECEIKHYERELAELLVEFQKEQKRKREDYINATDA